MNDVLISKIQSTIQGELPLLSDRLRSWAESHLTVPKQIQVYEDPDGKGDTIDVWLVTDKTGANDSAYRVVYDNTSQTFGLECKVDRGISWLMGGYGYFAETVEAM